VVLVENPPADVGWMMRMIRTPVISAVEKTTDADPDGILQTTFTVRNSFVQQSHAAVQAQPPRHQRFLRRLRGFLFGCWFFRLSRVNRTEGQDHNAQQSPYH